MRDASLLVKDAVIVALQGSAALSALNGGRVWDDIPPPPPSNAPVEQAFTSVDILSTEPWGNDEYRGSEVTLQIDNWATPSEDEPDQYRIAAQMNVATADALFGQNKIAVSTGSPGDWFVHGVWIDQTRVLRDPNGTTAHGIVQIHVNLTPVIPAY